MMILNKFWNTMIYCSDTTTVWMPYSNATSVLISRPRIN